MRILVAGANRVDAGKTTFARGLLARIGGVGFKPRAGHDYWFDHQAYRSAVETGRLYGKDAARLAAASDGDPEPEDINPVHRLWRPAPGGDDFIGRADRQFVLDRAGTGYIVNAAAAVPESARRALPIDDARTVSTVDELNDAMAALALPAQDALTDRIRRTDPAVIESYGDVARPATDLSVDRVAVVEPERMRAYDGDRYLDACEVAGGSPRDGQLEEGVGDVVELLEPTATSALEPLPDSRRQDPARIAGAYEAAYDALLAA